MKTEKKKNNNLSSWCPVMVKRLFLAVPGGCLQFVIVVFPDHTHYFCSVQVCNISKILLLTKKQIEYMLDQRRVT